MACTKERASLINELAIGKLPAEQSGELLDHVSACDECSATLDMVSGILASQERYGASVFEGEPSFIVKLFETMKDVLKSIFATRPFIRVAVPVVVTAAVLFLLLRPQDLSEYARLAQFEPPGYIPRVLRGPGVDKSMNGLFDEAMAAYVRRDFSRTIEKLSEVVQAHPEFGEASFYLGISYLMKNEGRRAVDVLQNAFFPLEGYPLGEQCLWYLGMAYLRIEEGQKALDQFQKIVDLDSDFKVNAERMIERINRIQGER